jgi:hypothetical protein
MVRFEKPRVFLLKSSWTSSTAAEFFSWAELQLSWASSAAVELNFSCECLWPYTNWTCLRAVELGFSLLNSLVKTSWTGPEGQFSWSLTPLTSDQQSTSQTGKQVARAVRGGSTGLVNPGQPAGQSANQSDSLTSRQSAWPARGGSTALGAVQPVSDRKICPTASFELHLYILTPTSLSYTRARPKLHF